MTVLGSELIFAGEVDDEAYQERGKTTDRLGERCSGLWGEAIDSQIDRNSEADEMVRYIEIHGVAR